MKNEEIILNIIIVLVVISIVFSIMYAAYMGTKMKQFPKVNFSRFKSAEVNGDVDGIQQLTNRAIRGVNGWMWLATAFMILYYLFNFWSISFMLLNLVIVLYSPDQNQAVIIFLVSGSLLFTCLELWLNTKEKSIHFHEQWFVTSAITKEYIVKFCAASKFEELYRSVIDYNNRIYETNRNIHFL